MLIAWLSAFHKVQGDQGANPPNLQNTAEDERIFRFKSMTKGTRRLEPHPANQPQGLEPPTRVCSPKSPADCEPCDAPATNMIRKNPETPFHGNSQRTTIILSYIHRPQKVITVDEHLISPVYCNCRGNMVYEVVQDFLHPQYDGCSKFPIGGPPWVAAATTCHLGFRV